ncbi:MAG: sporulation integral membrane protein YtvI [Clostridiales bacterium]|nr:sporulation integral membrane protein YtvI [Clostridiales bacterium]
MVRKSTLKRVLLIAVAVVITILAVANIRSILHLCGYILWLFIPFITSYFVSLLVNPMADGLQKRFRLPRGASAVLVIVLTVGVIGGIVSGIVWKIVDELKGIYEDFPNIYTNIRLTWYEVTTSFSGIWNNLPEVIREAANGMYAQVMDWIANFAKNTNVVEFAGNFAKKLPSVFISIIVFLISLYFMVSDSETVSKAVRHPFKNDFLEKAATLKLEIKRYVGGYVKAQLVIICIAFTILMIGLLLMRVKYALVIALATALVDALPFFGSGTVLIPWAVVSLVSGNVSFGIRLLIIYLSVVLMRQFIEPKIVSKNVGMHPLLTLMSMYIGYRIFSIGGMILGPLVLMMTISFYKVGIFDEPIKFVKNTSLKIKREFENIKKLIENEGE